jgi:glucan biosynthesis protein C
MDASITTPQRIDFIDNLRGIATLLGIVMHSAVAFMVNCPPYWVTASPTRHLAFDLLAFYMRTFRLEIFFIIAGLCAHLLITKGLVYFIRNRLSRIVYPFLVAWAAASILLPMAAGYPPLSFPQYQPYHLWFLYYLLMIYLLLIPIQLLLKQFPINMEPVISLFAQLMRSRWRFCILAAISIFPLSQMKSLVVLAPVGLTPDLPLLVHYSIVFFFGWMLYYRLDLLSILKKNCYFYLAIAVMLGNPLAIDIQNIGLFPAHITLNLLPIRYFYGIVSWLMIFGVTGLCLRLFTKPSKIMQFVADASYWVYITHFFVVFYIQHLLQHSTLHIVAQFYLNITVTTIVVFTSYYYLRKIPFKNIRRQIVGSGWSTYSPQLGFRFLASQFALSIKKMLRAN